MTANTSPITPEVEKKLYEELNNRSRKINEALAELNKGAALRLFQMGYDQACRDYKVGKFAR